MSTLYSPPNTFYGEQGSLQICNNSQSEEDEAACEADAETWYSSFDYVEKDKIHSRLTWNPYFEETMSTALSGLNSSSAKYVNIFDSLKYFSKLSHRLT